MNNKHKLTIYYSLVLFSILIFVVSTERLLIKADLPFEYNGDLILQHPYVSILPGSKIISVDNIYIHSDFQLEFILDSRSVGDPTTIETSYAGINTINEVYLVPYYENLTFTIISLVVGITFLITAVFVISRKANDPNARILFWILLLFSVAVASSPGTFFLKDDYLAMIIRVSHTLSYSLGIAAFLHLSYVFPRKIKFANLLVYVTYILYALFSIFLSPVIINSMVTLHTSSIELHELSWTILLASLTVSVILGVLIFYVKTWRLNIRSERDKVYWILWGLAMGVFPYLILYVVPRIFRKPSIIPEEYAMLPMVLVPVSFAVAVIRYHIFDIELLIKRSIIYAVLTGFVLTFYFAIVLGMTSLIHEFAGEIDRITSLVAAITIAVLFIPVRNRVQNFVDRSFYRERYNFEQAVNSFSGKVNECSTLGQLGLKVMDEIQNLVPVDKFALILSTDEGSRIKILAHKNMDDVLENIAAFRVKKISSELNKPFALSEKVQHDIDIDTTLSNVFKKWEIAIAFPLKLESDIVIGAIVLGNKLSGMRFSQNDFDLLNVISSECALAVKRLQLQEKLVLKEIEKQKLEELNSLKSFFVASVSHDLKTPLSSINMYAELLQHKKKKTPRLSKEYLQIIQGESSRLARLIDNVLNLAMIEKGIKEYQFSRLNLSETIKEALLIMEYQFKMNKFRIKTSIGRRNIFVTGDKDSIIEAVTNVLSNAVKYSPNRKEIKISAHRCADIAEVVVTDKGEGISGENLENIFSPYFRSKESSYIKGTGIGLAVVKHIMDAHGGRVEVESKLGSGSTFTLKFPLKNNEH